MIGELAVIAGIALIGAVLVDMGLTVLHPTIRGPVSHRVTRLVWRLARTVARVSGRRVVLEFAGPLVTVSLLATWIVGLWLGFGLVLVPSFAHFSSSVRLGHTGLLAALLPLHRRRDRRDQLQRNQRGRRPGSAERLAPARQGRRRAAARR